MGRKWVKLNGRDFIVVVDSDGTPLRIIERKKFGKYPLDGYYNASYWSAKHHRIGSSDTLVSQILQKSREETDGK